jgi:hypothetical protein
VLYSTCDGIPRLRFISSPTILQTTTISVIHTVFQTFETNTAPKQDKQKFWTATPSCQLKITGDLCKPDSPILEPLHLLGQQLGIPGEDSLFVRDCPSGEERCGVDMETEIVLLFWPPEIESPNICNTIRSDPVHYPLSSSQVPRVVTMSEIVFQARDLYYRGKLTEGTLSTLQSVQGHVKSSVLKGPFTFTSPTVYVAHHPITGYFDHVEASIPYWTTVLKSAGILTLDPTDILSVRPLPSQNATVGSDYPMLVANGQYLRSRQEARDFEEYVTFDYNNLLNPVPASAYFDARHGDCWGEQSHCRTITDDSYRPRIVIKGNALAQFMPSRQSNLTCVIPDLVDPPMSLRPIYRDIDVPTLPFPNHISEPTGGSETVYSALAVQPGDRISSHSPSRTGAPIHTTAPMQKPALMQAIMPTQSSGQNGNGNELETAKRRMKLGNIVFENKADKRKGPLHLIAWRDHV